MLICQECNGQETILHEYAIPVCCGKTNWECLGYCAVPELVQEQVSCPKCKGEGYELSISNNDTYEKTD